MSSYFVQHKILDDVWSTPTHRAEAKDDLVRYFEPGSYTGAQFNSFREADNFGDAANRITWDDIIAVKMLSVDIPTKSCLRLINDDGSRISQLLAQIDPAPVGEAAGDPLRGDGPADELWHLLTGIKGIGWVTASKLLARKRPHVVPVYDEVVREVLHSPKGFWRCMSSYFKDDPTQARAHEWASLRDDALNSDELSVLRTVDVVLWMRGKRGE